MLGENLWKGLLGIIKKQFFYWRIVALQYCVSFFCIAKGISCIYAHILFFRFPSCLGHHRAMSSLVIICDESLLADHLLYEGPGIVVNFPSSVQFSHSVLSDSLQPHELQYSRPPCPPNPSLPKAMPIELVTPSSYLILCHSLLLLPSIFPSIRVFPNESALYIR